MVFFSLFNFNCIFFLNLCIIYLFVEQGELLSQILAERCDGNRNLLHACVSVCAPISNKELEGIKNKHFFLVNISLKNY